MDVLVADDDAVNRTLLERLLTRWGHRVQTAADGGQALRALEAPEPPSLALLDWLMPELPGVDVCRRVRERATAEPPYLILVTSLDSKADVVAGLEAGADDYITKPFSPDEVRARVAVGSRIVTLQRSVADRVKELEAALAEVQHLQGLLPMCAWCKRIRNESQYWERVDTYIAARTRATFTHGICPECRAKIRPGPGGDEHDTARA